MKGINEWAKEVKHNKEFAKKFEGVKNVEDILNIAKENGYSFTAKELENCDLNKVAGGAELDGGGVGQHIKVTVNPNTNIKVNKIGVSGAATGKDAKAEVSPSITVNN